jgi:ribosomal protein S18 acetylase RimI-like enzyme
MRCFVATEDNRICGYVLWAEKSGFRDEVVLELEQIGVLPNHQGRGIGKALILNSLPRVANQLSERGARLKAVVVTTRTDNGAQGLYRKTLGAQVEAVIPNLYSADEVIMIARNPMAHTPPAQPDALDRRSGTV